MCHLVQIQEGLTINNVWLSLICVFESLHNSPTELLQTLAPSCVSDMEIIIEYICRSSISQLPQCGRALLLHQQSGFAAGIEMLLEVLFTSLQCVSNA